MKPGGRPPARAIPFFPILPTFFIMAFICWYCLRRRLTSCTEVPEPAAMRRLRDALRILELRRSAGVMERITASWRAIVLSSTLARAICCLILPTPGSMPSRPWMSPILRTWLNCRAMSSRVKRPLAIFAAIFAASASSTVSATLSTRPTTSPMPRMRPATRSALKTSSASSFSPTPNSLIGHPVTARMDSAAPPRASPSTRVRTMPVIPTLSWNSLARVTAS